jgi:hypothetical protein
MLARSGITIAALLAAVAVSRAARADVVMPPPTDCPRGQTGETSHAGPRCVPVAPKDCPPGWRGILGGTCMLAPCIDDKGCQEGEACVAHSVCLQPFVDELYDYGEEEREKQGMNDFIEPGEDALLRSPGLLAGPPMPKTKRPKPITRYNAINVCSAEVACAAPAVCQTEKLCVPRGSRALAYRGSNISPARVARKTDTPITTSDAPATEASAPFPPPGRGCAGCTAASSAPELPCAIGAAAAAGIAVMRRRRR